MIRLRWLETLLVAGLGLVIIEHWITLPRLLTYEHAWVSADNALQARYFASYGLLASKAIPVNNNPPWGIPAAAYIHWPPLFPLALAGWFRVFGETESTIHAFTLVIQLATFGALYALLRSALSRAAAAVGGLIWLALPGNLRFGHAALHLHLAVFFLIAGTAVFLRTLDDPQGKRRWIWGAVAIFLGALSSWEAVLTPVGLSAGAWAMSNRRGVRHGMVYFLAGASGAAGILGWYLLNSPTLAADTLQSVLFRLGMGHVYSSRVIYNQGGQDHLWFPAAMRAEAANLAGVVGVLGLCVIAAYLACQTDSWRAKSVQLHLVGFLGAFAPLVLWFALFWNHAGVHAYESILAMAPAAMAGGWLFQTLQAHFGAERGLAKVRFAALQILLPLALIAPLAAELYDTTLSARRHDLNVPDSAVLMGRAIAASTPPGSIVLTPERSLVPVWYSGRNTSRFITNDRQVREAVRNFQATVPNSRIYLVFRPEDRPGFTAILDAHPSTDIGDGLVLTELGGDAR